MNKDYHELIYIVKNENFEEVNRRIKLVTDAFDAVMTHFYYGLDNVKYVFNMHCTKLKAEQLNSTISVLVNDAQNE